MGYALGFLRKAVPEKKQLWQNLTSKMSSFLIQGEKAAGIHMCHECSHSGKTECTACQWCL